MLEIIRTNICGRNADHCFLLLFALFAVWQLAGILPPVSYEGDALSICAGCEHTYNNGWSSLGDTGYGYWMQPFAYIVVVALKHVFRAADCQTIYCLLSSSAAILLQLLSVVFANRIAGTGRHWALLALVLLPESYALAMYPNSAVLSGCQFVGGLCLLQSRRYVAAWALLVLAPLFRLDVLIVYPMITIVIAQTGRTWKFACLSSVAFGCLLAVVLGVVYPLVNADIFHTANEYARWSGIISFKKNLAAVYGFYGLVFPLLVLAGIIVCARRRSYALLFMSLAALVLVHALMSGFGNAAKHFSVLIPFVLPLGAVALPALMTARNVALKWIFVAVTALSQLFGVRAGEGVFSQAALNKYVPDILSFDMAIGQRHFEFVLGGGQPLMTADEAVLTSGNFFYPMFIHNLKIADEAKVAVFVDKAQQSGARFVFGAWEEQARIEMLVEQGLVPAENVVHDACLFNAALDADLAEDTEEIAALLRQHRQDSAAVYFVATEAVSHRWSKLLNALGEQGLLAPVDTTGTIYAPRR